MPEPLEYKSPPPPAPRKSIWPSGGFLVKTAKTAGQVNKRVTCEQCQTRYLYQLSRRRQMVSFVPLITLLALLPLLILTPCLMVTPLGLRLFLIMRRLGVASSPLRLIMNVSGEGGDEDTDISANKKLRKALLNGVEPVPCPQCGWYQKNMVWESRSRFLAWLPWMGLLPLVISAALALRLISHHPDGYIGIAQTGPHYKFLTWIICLSAGASCILLLQGIRWLLALPHSPNAGFPAQREPYPDSPPAIRESDHNAGIAAATAKLKPVRFARVTKPKTFPPPTPPPEAKKPNPPL